MEIEKLDLEVLIREIMMIPNNPYTEEDLQTKSYIELLDIRDKLYQL